ncbi:hypothetical protein M9Y10_030339 [Tritrichomonas musculus]|uniref:ubiquitinyl hydrolase 1 n=1 Tax=Tritrichomonas musculus TaxID=1915356 RepID=A0ABR2KQQ5_9EUKA
MDDYDSISQPHICAFEVENFDSYLIPCKISMKEKSTNFPKIIGKPFLLSFDHPDPTEEEISNCAFSHLKCLWDTNDEPDPTEYIKNIVNKPIVAKISENNLRGKQLHFDSKYPNLEKSIIDINLNPLFMKNDSITKFSYYKLYCNLKPKIEKPISKISLKNCFSNLCRTSTLGYGNEWKCPNCNQDVCAIEKVGLWTVLDSLIIDVGKINSSGKMPVKYDAELYLTDFFVDQNAYQKEVIYKLCSVVECRSHQYTSHVFVNNQKQVKGKWYFFDNSGICEADEQSAINESASILFYQRVMNYTFYYSIFLSPNSIFYLAF